MFARSCEGRCGFGFEGAGPCCSPVAWWPGSLYGCRVAVLLATVARVNRGGSNPVAPAAHRVFHGFLGNIAAVARVPGGARSVTAHRRVRHAARRIVNHAGSALYECAAAMFIAQAYGLPVFATQFTVVILR